MTGNYHLLPKWAQHELAELRSERDRLAETLSSIRDASDGVADTFHRPTSDALWLPVGCGHEVRYDLTNAVVHVQRVGHRLRVTLAGGPPVEHPPGFTIKVIDRRKLTIGVTT